MLLIYQIDAICMQNGAVDFQILGQKHAVKGDCVDNNN